MQRLPNIIHWKRFQQVSWSNDHSFFNCKIILIYFECKRFLRFFSKIASICVYLYISISIGIAKICIVEFKVEEVIVRVDKPSALTLAKAPAVEIKRNRYLT